MEMYNISLISDFMVVTIVIKFDSTSELNQETCSEIWFRSNFKLI
jgi:hypothetical protein